MFVIEATFSRDLRADYSILLRAFIIFTLCILSSFIIIVVTMCVRGWINVDAFHFKAIVCRPIHVVLDWNEFLSVF